VYSVNDGVRPRTDLDGDPDPLDDPATRHLAKACLRKGQPLVEVAQVLGVCADELAALLGIEGK
jgi:hypothetical protein